MGLLVDGTTAAGVLTVNFSRGLGALGFRMAANELSMFDATVRIFSGLNGTGVQIDQLNLRDLAGGGLCTSLSASSNSNLVPNPCNDAPFLGFLATGGIRSLTVGTSDTRGFYIGNLLYTPESSRNRRRSYCAGSVWPRSSLATGAAAARKRQTARHLSCHSPIRSVSPHPLEICR